MRMWSNKTYTFFIFDRDEQPECIACQKFYSVKNFLIECCDLVLVRQDFYNV